MNARRPQEFGDTGSTWPTYRVRLEAYFEAHNITDPTKKRELLISSLTDSAVGMVQGRSHPKEVKELNYMVVAAHLKEHYAPQVNKIDARTKIR